MDSKETEYVAKVDAIFNHKNEDDQLLWKQRAIVKTLEVIGFLGTFLCTNPVGFTFSVILTAIALMIDFYLQYSEWKRHQRLKEIFE